MCLHVYVCITCVLGDQKRAKDPLGLKLKSCEPLCGSQELNLGTLQGQYRLLATLQPHFSVKSLIFKKQISYSKSIVIAYSKANMMMSRGPVRAAVTHCKLGLCAPVSFSRRHNHL